MQLYPLYGYNSEWMLADRILAIKKTLHRNETDKEIGMNDIARVSIKTTVPLYHDPYRKNRITGSIILIDEGTNETVGAGMIV